MTVISINCQLTLGKYFSCSIGEAIFLNNVLMRVFWMSTRTAMAGSILAISSTTNMEAMNEDPHPPTNEMAIITRLMYGKNGNDKAVTDPHVTELWPNLNENSFLYIRQLKSVPLNVVSMGISTTGRGAASFSFGKHGAKRKTTRNWTNVTFFKRLSVTLQRTVDISSKKSSMEVTCISRYNSLWRIDVDP